MYIFMDFYSKGCDRPFLLQLLQLLHRKDFKHSTKLFLNELTFQQLGNKYSILKNTELIIS